MIVLNFTFEKTVNIIFFIWSTFSFIIKVIKKKSIDKNMLHNSDQS